MSVGRNSFEGDSIGAIQDSIRSLIRLSIRSFEHGSYATKFLVQELNSSYYNPETILLTIDP